MLDKILPGRLAHFLACAFVFALVGGAGYLTYQATIEDLTNQKFQTDRHRAEEAAERAKLLADQEGIAPEGAGYLLRRDPGYHGRHALEQKCLSCHYFGGQGQLTHLEATLNADDLARATDVPEVSGVPAEVVKVLAVKIPGYKPATGKPIEDGGRVVAYAFEGTNPLGESVEARVEPETNRVEWTVRTRQTASDLQHYGSPQWLRGLLDNPSSDHYFGKVPQCGGMARWKKNTKLTASELDQIADFFAKHMMTIPEDLPPSEWIEREEVYSHPGFDLFHKDGECASCHVTIDWGSANEEAPNLYGWGSPWYLKRLIARPGAPTSTATSTNPNRCPPSATSSPRTTWRRSSASSRTTTSAPSSPRPVLVEPLSPRQAPERIDEERLFGFSSDRPGPLSGIKDGSRADPT